MTYDAIIAEARTWLGTPYHHGACVKGAGCDCATLLYAVLNHCGLLEREDLGYYSPDWFAHAGEETYMRRLLRHAYKTAEGISYATLDARPGTLVLTRHHNSSKLYNHAGIVTNWPKLIHAVHPKVEEIDATQHTMWSNREVLVLDPVAKSRAMQTEHKTYVEQWP